MKSFALKIVRNNFPELVNTNRIRKLSKELLIDILEDLSKLFFIKPANLGSSSGSQSPTTTTLNSIYSFTNQSYQLQMPPSSGSTFNYFITAQTPVGISSTNQFSASLLGNNLQSATAHQSSAANVHNNFIGPANLDENLNTK